MVNRVAERVLAIISAVFTTFALVGSVVFLGLINVGLSDAEMRADIEAEIYNDPTFTVEEADMIVMVIDVMAGFMWVVIIALIISLVLNIIGMFLIWNSSNAKVAGILFILSGLINFILSISSILLYIAAVLSFTKKPSENVPQVGNESSESDFRPL